MRSFTTFEKTTTLQWDVKESASELTLSLNGSDNKRYGDGNLYKIVLQKLSNQYSIQVCFDCKKDSANYFRIIKEATDHAENLALKLKLQSSPLTELHYQVVQSFKSNQLIAGFNFIQDFVQFDETVEDNILIFMNLMPKPNANKLTLALVDQLDQKASPTAPNHLNTQLKITIPDEILSPIEIFSIFPRLKSAKKFCQTGVIWPDKDLDAVDNVPQINRLAKSKVNSMKLKG